MSTNLIDNDNDNNIENFSLPGYTGDNINNKSTSFSSLNIDESNLYNSTFSGLLGNDTFITKQNHSFDNKMDTINDYYYNKKPGSASGCKDQCAKVSACSSYTYNNSDKLCNIFNTIPKKFKKNDGVVSGYNTSNKSFAIDDLDKNKITNLQNRIGSMYLQKRFNVINTDENKNINKSVKSYITRSKVTMKLTVQTGSGRWDGSRKLVQTYLSLDGTKVSDTTNINNNFRRGSKSTINVNYNMIDDKFNNICFTVTNDGIRILHIDLYLTVSGHTVSILSMPCSGNWIIGKTYCFKLPKNKIIDLNNVEFGSNIISTFKGQGSEMIDKTYKPSDTTKIDTILDKSNWSISVDMSVQKNYGGWRNVFLHGNNNYERAPALWIWPGNPWRFHFRIRTGRSWNDGVDFYIPSQFRSYNKKLNIKISYSTYTYWWSWRESECYAWDYFFGIKYACLKKHNVTKWRSRPSFKIKISVNGVECANKGFEYPFYPLRNRNLTIKYQYNKSGYTVDNITFKYESPLAHLNTNVNPIVSNKVQSYTAGSECIYHNINNPKRIVTQNIKLLSSKDIDKYTGQPPNNQQIKNQIETNKRIEEDKNTFENESNNVIVGSDDSYLNTVNEINNSQDDEPIDGNDNFNALNEAVGEPKETFENKKLIIINNTYKTKQYLILLCILLLLIIMYYNFY